MSGVSLSKARLREMLQSDKEEREAIGHHTKKIEEQGTRFEEHSDRIREINIRLDKLELRVETGELWHAIFSKVNVWRRFKWLLSGR